ncbi:hypothetical protein ACFCV8_35010 [Streptomyces sp. NPDC056347]|uniref:hypothetical protein n=1 Tax=unclassified Streptomyces TaxID=2593676 RepID=UPI0035D9532A
MARHALSRSRRRALLRAGLTVTAVGAALGAGGAAAQAATPAPVPAVGTESGSGLGTDADAALGATTGALGVALKYGIAPVTHLRLDPLAGTGTDPLTNGLETQVADFKPLSTTALTDPLTSGGALKDLPLVGPLAEGLRGGL